MVRQRLRIRFCKQGDLRLIGHRDLMRCFERLFRRAGLPLGMSEGFHPKPRMTFPLALAVGIEGTDEVMELELAQSCTAEQVHARLAEYLPTGLVLKAVEALPTGTKKGRVTSVVYEVPIPPQCREGLPEMIDRLLAAESFPVQRSRGRSSIDLRASLEELTLREDGLRMRLRIENQAGSKPQEVLAALGLEEQQLEGVHPTRTVVEIQS
ncbi:MAG TPA: TIGR03936 family radical SAM-associated protein [Thermoguttaceae bacterium]|nr:TIGR03936 family radical SAM-associated protein [Thermoguttaceae bacterium]